MAKKKTYRKKRYVKRAPKKSVTTTNFSKEPIAPRLLTKLRYNDMQTLTSSYTAGTDNQVRLNSLFYPGQTHGVSSRQPYGYDQLATFYNRYRVYKVTGFVMAFSNSTTPISVVLLANNIGTDITDIDLAGENPRALVNYCSENHPAKFKVNFLLRDITGATKSQYQGDDRYQAVTTTNPAEVINLHCVYKTPIGTNDVTFKLQHNLTFWCEMFDTHALPSS